MSSLPMPKAFIVAALPPEFSAQAPTAPIIYTERTLEAFFMRIALSLQSWPHPLVNGIGYATFRLKGVRFETEPTPHPLKGSRKYYARWEAMVRKDHHIPAGTHIPPDLKPGPCEQRWLQLVAKHLKPIPGLHANYEASLAWQNLLALCEKNGLSCWMQTYATSVAEVGVTIRRHFVGTTCFRLEGLGFGNEPRPPADMKPHRFYASWAKVLRADQGLKAGEPISPHLKPGPREIRWLQLTTRWLKPLAEGQKRRTRKVRVPEDRTLFQSAFFGTEQPLPWLHGPLGGSQHNWPALPKHQPFAFPPFKPSPPHRRSIRNTLRLHGYGKDALWFLYRQWERHSLLGRKVRTQRAKVEDIWLPKAQRAWTRLCSRFQGRAQPAPETYGPPAPLLKECFGSPGPQWVTLREAEYQVFCKPGLYRLNPLSPEADNTAWNEAVRKIAHERWRQTHSGEPPPGPPPSKAST